MKPTRPTWLAPVAIWAAASLFFWIVMIWVRIFSPDWIFDGFKIREESADSAWQTIRLNEMWSYGPSTLWWEHIYPPLYDGIRYVLMQPEVNSEGAPDVIAVDFRLYILHSILFGLTAMIVYLWVRDLTSSGWWGAVGAMFWTFVPASISYFVLMNQTGLAISAMAVCFYFLYRFCRTRRFAYSAGFLGALLVASLTRNVVQIHVLVVVAIAAVAFFFMSRNRRWWMLAANLVLVAMIAFWPIRAYALYATFDVSTHTGYNRAGALWLNPLSVPMAVPESVMDQYRVFDEARREAEDPIRLAKKSPEQIREAQIAFDQAQQVWAEQSAEYPGVDFATATAYPDQIVVNALKLSSNFNTQETVLDNFRLGKATNDLILKEPLTAIQNSIKSLGVTIPTMFRSIEVQWWNGWNATFPFIGVLDWIFSGWRFPLLILLAAATIIRYLGWRSSLRTVGRYGWFAVFWVLTAIPVFLSNRYWPPDIPEPTHSEADRLRALIDIPVYVLITFAAFILVGDLRRRRLSKRRAHRADVAVPGSMQEAS